MTRWALAVLVTVSGCNRQSIHVPAPQAEQRDKEETAGLSSQEAPWLSYPFAERICRSEKVISVRQTKHFTVENGRTQFTGMEGVTFVLDSQVVGFVPITLWQYTGSRQVPEPKDTDIRKIQIPFEKLRQAAARINNARSTDELEMQSQFLSLQLGQYLSPLQLTTRLARKGEFFVNTSPDIAVTFFKPIELADGYSRPDRSLFEKIHGRMGGRLMEMRGQLERARTVWEDASKKLGKSSEAETLHLQASKEYQAAMYEFGLRYVEGYREYLGQLAERLQTPAK